MRSTRQAPLARSMPSLRAPNEEWDSWVRVPSFVLRGVGRQARYEYEVRLYTEEESWVLMRRYQRFRELHLSMCAKYGRQVILKQILTKKKILLGVYRWKLYNSHPDSGFHLTRKASHVNVELC